MYSSIVCQSQDHGIVEGHLRPASLLNASAVLPASLLGVLPLLLVEAALQDSSLSLFNLQGAIGCGTTGHRTVCLLPNLETVCLSCGNCNSAMRMP